MPLLPLLLVSISVVLLWFGADWIVDSAAAVARTLKIPELVIGLTVVAFGTSAPEFVVTTAAAFKGLESLSLSNVIGSNILNLGLILGLVAMIRPIAARRTILFRDGLSLLVLTVILLVLGRPLVLDRFSGVFLLALLAGYIIFLFFKGKTFSLDENDHREATLRDYPKLALGFAAITLGGNLLVEGARDIALALGASEWIIGLTIVAGGTSLPELVTCLAASIRGKNDMLLGNLIGSNFFNIAGVLGLTCLLRPLNVSPEALTGLFFLLAHLLVVLIFLRTGWRISRLEGGLLIAFNLGYWVLDATMY